MGLSQSYIINPRISIKSLYIIMTSSEEESSNEEETSPESSSSLQDSCNEAKKKCVVCLLENPEYVITTCWHKCLCLKCGQSLTLCPICRTVFDPSTELKKVFES